MIISARGVPGGLAQAPKKHSPKTGLASYIPEPGPGPGPRIPGPDGPGPGGNWL